MTRMDCEMMENLNPETCGRMRHWPAVPTAGCCVWWPGLCPTGVWLLWLWLLELRLFFLCPQKEFSGNVGLKVSFGDVNLGHFLVLVLMGST